MGLGDNVSIQAGRLEAAMKLKPLSDLYYSGTNLFSILSPPPIGPFPTSQLLDIRVSGLSSRY